jgi:hypothetical protein
MLERFSVCRKMLLHASMEHLSTASIFFQAMITEHCAGDHQNLLTRVDSEKTCRAGYEYISFWVDHNALGAERNIL